MRLPTVRALQALWLLTAPVCMVMIGAGLPAYFTQLSHPPIDVVRSLRHAGVPVHVYAVYLTAMVGIGTVGGGAIAGLIAWRRFHDAAGLITSLFLILLAAGAPPISSPAAEVFPALTAPANALAFLMVLFLVVFLMTFPDGHVVPRRATIPFSIGVGAAVAAFLLTRGYTGAEQDDLVNLPILAGAIAGIASQIYRYRRVAEAVQRQQTKWVLLGASIAVGGTLVETFSPLPTLGIAGTPYDSTSVTFLTIAFLLIPISVGIAMLRYRLWDVDLLIHRTLVYGSLTVSLAALYLGTVIALQALFRALTGQTSELAVAVATLAIAALSNPWRRRIQTFIDRRFYRHKYDATQALATFQARLRHEVDMEQLQDDIMTVLHETVQPSNASIWLAQHRETV